MLELSGCDNGEPVSLPLASSGPHTGALDFPGRDNEKQRSFSLYHGVSSAFVSGEHESSVCDPGELFPQDGVPESHVSFSSALPDKVSPSLADARQMIVQFATHLMNVSPNIDGETPRDLVHGPSQPASQFGSSSSPPPSQLPVENLFSQQYEGQLPFLRDHRLADLSSRQRGERFETTHGVEASSGFAKDVRATSKGSCDGEHDRSTNDLQHSWGSVLPLALRLSTSGQSSPFSSDARSDSLPEAQRVGDLEDARVSSGEPCDGEHDSHKNVLQHTLGSVSSSRSRFNATNHQSLSSSDAEFDALLEAQRMADLAIPAVESTNHPKRKREVLSDQAYRLRKERTDNLLEGYRSVALRRSPRLKNRALPEDYDPPPPNLGRGTIPTARTRILRLRGFGIVLGI